MYGVCMFMCKCAGVVVAHHLGGICGWLFEAVVTCLGWQ